MPRHYTVDENRAWHNDQPTKLLASMVLFVVSDGRYLLVEPNYKPGLSLVGGVVDKDESPVEAAVRETREEIGLEIDASRLSLLAVKYNPPVDGFSDMVQFLFTSQLSEEEIGRINIQESELDGFRLSTDIEIRGAVISDMIRVALEAYEQGPGFFDEANRRTSSFEKPA